MNDDIQKRLIQLVFIKFHSEEFIYNVLGALQKDSEREKMIEYLEKTEKPTKTDVEIEMIHIRGLIKKI